MSRIEELVKKKKAKQDRDGWKEGKKVTITARFDEFSIFCLDKIVEKIGGTRTSNVQDFVSEAIYDGLNALGFTFENLKNEYFAKDGGGIFLDGVKLDPKEVEHFLAHGGEKFGVQPEPMTEEEIAEAEAREEAEKEKEIK